MSSEGGPSAGQMAEPNTSPRLDGTGRQRLLIIDRMMDDHHERLQEQFTTMSTEIQTYMADFKIDILRQNRTFQANLTGVLLDYVKETSSELQKLKQKVFASPTSELGEASRDSSDVPVQRGMPIEEDLVPETPEDRPASCAAAAASDKQPGGAASSAMGAPATPTTAEPSSIDQPEGAASSAMGAPAAPTAAASGKKWRRATTKDSKQTAASALQKCASCHPAGCSCSFPQSDYKQAVEASSVQQAAAASGKTRAVEASSGTLEEDDLSDTLAADEWNDTQAGLEGAF